MSSKDKILGRIREALREPALVPGHHDDHGTAQVHASSEFKQWLPAVGDDLDSQLALFAKNSADLKTEFLLLPNRSDLPGCLAELARQSNWQRVATHAGELTDAFVPTLGLPTLQTGGGYAVDELERSDVGITQCDALVAQTGSVLITSRSAGGRALSVLPPHHVVLATREQMVPDLASAYGVLKRNYGSQYPSLISFITGPSRTGDIERILVLGAHGPKRLTVICC